MKQKFPKWSPYAAVGLVLVIILVIIFSTTGKRPVEETTASREAPSATAPEPKTDEVAKTPDEEAYDKARNLYYEGKYKEAIEAYRKLIKDYPKSEYGDDAQYEIAMCYEFLEDYKKAIEEYEKLIKNYPNSEYVDGAKSSIEYLKEYAK